MERLRKRNNRTLANTLSALLIGCIFISGNLFAQEQNDNSSAVADSSKKTFAKEFKEGFEEGFEEGVDKKSDTVRISWGSNKKILVITNGSDTVKIKKKRKIERVNHFAGLDLGINGYTNPDMSIDLQKSAEFMDVNYGKSIEFAFNFYEKYIPIAKEKFGIMTGLGLKYNSYDLKNDVLIVNQNNKTIPTTDTTKSIKKNRFKSTMLDLPLMLETNIGKTAEESFHLAVGGMVSYRIGSKTKQKYKQDGDNHKDKDRNDFNMNPFRFSAVARVGYGDFTLYASYSLTPLFEKDKGPELYPFTVGISLVSF